MRRPLLERFWRTMLVITVGTAPAGLWTGNGCLRLNPELDTFYTAALAAPFAAPAADGTVYPAGFIANLFSQQWNPDNNADGSPDDAALAYNTNHLFSQLTAYITSMVNVKMPHTWVDNPQTVR